MYTNYNSQNVNKEIEKDPNIYVTEQSKTPSDKLFSVIWKILLVVIILIVVFLGLIKFGVITLKSEVVPEAILLNQNEVGIKKGLGYQFIYTVLPENASNKQVVFESSDPSVVRVNETTGYVEALKNGTATITVKTLINEKVSECVVKVADKNVSLRAININEKRISLAVGYTNTLSYRITPSDATNASLIFTSSDSSVATINSKGVIKAIKPGTSIITVSSSNGSVKDTAYVTVYKQGTSTVVNGESVKTETYPSTIKLSDTNVNLTIGSTNQMNASITPSGASQKVTWSSSNSRVATVNQNGLVTAVGVGSTTIVAKTINNKTAVSTVKVGNYSLSLKSIDVTTNYSVLPVGITKKLYVAFIPSNASNKSITWLSDNPSVATVDSSGNVKAISKGTAKITAQSVDGGFKDTATIEVIERENIVEEKGISFTSSSYSLGVNSTITLTPTITPSNASYKTIDFTSSNSKVATVDSNGVVRGISPGTATITATTRRNKIKTTAVVNVENIPATGISLSEISVTMPLNETYNLTAVVLPSNASDKTVEYKSKNTKVATVDATGMVKAVGAGTTTITITPKSGGNSASCIIKVAKNAKLSIEYASKS